MSKICKYTALTEWLQGCNADTVRLSFEELNNIIKLPHSAYSYRAAWANCATSNATSFQKSWQNTGFVVNDINLLEQWVVFKKGTSKQKTTTGFRKELSRNVSVRGITEALQCGYACYDSINSDGNHRYLSWEHCHEVFKQNRHRQDDATVDYLCIHLAWYLASWGMLRNSFLMQKDYKVHRDVVKMLCQPEWDSLWDITAANLAREDYAKGIMLLAKKITETYSRVGRPSETLLTKILLGTIGCTPAYDRYFKKGLSATNAAVQSFSTQSLVALGKLYMEHINEMEMLREHCSKRVEYPAAKIIDMCFFEYGYRLEVDNSEGD